MSLLLRFLKRWSRLGLLRPADNVNSPSPAASFNPSDLGEQR
jgi:hypothetical protein